MSLDEKQSTESDDLKKKDDSGVEKETVYYYSREHRLSHASPMVQAMNDGQNKKRSLSSSIFGSKSNLVLFATILIICASFVITSRYAKNDGSMKLGGNNLIVRILSDSEILVLDIKKNVPKSGEFYTGIVEILVSETKSKTKSEQMPIEFFSHRINFKAIETESFIIPIPLEGNDFFVILKTSAEEKSMRIKLKK